MNTYRLILLLPFFISLSCYSQDSTLLVEKGKLVWLMGKLEEGNVLKKRMVLKDSSISILNQRLVFKDDIIKSYQRDSVSYIAIVANKNTEISMKDEKIKQAHVNNKKLHKQNLLLKISIGILAITAIALR